MSVSSAQATYGLNAVGIPTSTNVSGSPTIGVANKQIALADSNVAYSLRAIMFAASNTLHLAPTTGSTSGSTAFVAGAAQVETATAAGTITGSGNATVTVTSAILTGSPLAVSVAVVNGDTAAQWADKARIALAANTAIAAKFTVDGSSTAIRLTANPSATYNSVPAYLANDATLNIALANGTCTGITAAPTSANTTAGVATSGTKIYDGDGLDFEGAAIAEIGGITAILIRGDNNQVTYTDSANFAGSVGGNGNGIDYQIDERFSTNSENNLLISPIVFTATAALGDVTITVTGVAL